MEEQEQTIKPKFKNFTRLHNELLDCTKLTIHEKMLMICLIRYNNNALQMSLPSEKRLSEMSGVSKSTIQRNLKNLETKNLIKILNIKTNRGDYLNNNYILNNTKETWIKLQNGDCITSPTTNANAEIVNLENYTQLHNELLDCTKLTIHEKMLMICLIRYRNATNNTAYPGAKLLSDVSRMTSRMTWNVINTLESKHLVKTISTKTKTGAYRNNMYVLNDCKETWIKLQNGQAIAELQEERKKESTTSSTNCQEDSDVETPNNSQNGVHQNDAHHENSTDTPKSQDGHFSSTHTKARDFISLDDIREIFDYDILVHDNPNYVDDIDMVMDILMDIYNRKQDIKIGGEIKSVEVVKGRVAKLNSEAIIYAIDKYNAQMRKGLIQNHNAYLISILYTAERDYRAYIKNHFLQDYGHLI